MSRIKRKIRTLKKPFRYQFDKAMGLCENRRGNIMGETSWFAYAPSVFDHMSSFRGYEIASYTLINIHVVDEVMNLLTEVCDKSLVREVIEGLWSHPMVENPSWVSMGWSVGIVPEMGRWGR